MGAVCRREVEVESKLEILIVHLLPGYQQERNVSRRRNGYLVSTAKHLPMNAFLIGWRHWRQVLYWVDVFVPNHYDGTKHPRSLSQLKINKYPLNLLYTSTIHQHAFLPPIQKWNNSVSWGEWSDMKRKWGMESSTLIQQLPSYQQPHTNRQRTRERDASAKLSHRNTLSRVFLMGLL